MNCLDHKINMTIENLNKSIKLKDLNMVIENERNKVFINNLFHFMLNVVYLFYMIYIFRIFKD
jgi:hypothetical protein